VAEGVDRGKATAPLAESTEIAGVIMLSPKNSEAPKIPSAASTIFARRLPGTPRLRIKVMWAVAQGRRAWPGDRVAAHRSQGCVLSVHR
jgi:hypothetical protein